MAFCTSNPARSPRALFAALFCLFLASHADRALAGDWIEDANGCKLWNPNPVMEESITWSGACKDGFVDGQGKLQWFAHGQPGTFEEGEFANGKPNGHIETRDSKGGRYVGDMVDDKRQGHGVLSEANGYTADGEWFDNKLQGKATVHWPNGNSYSGDFVAGLRSGKGVSTLADGTHYEGDFLNDGWNGQGAITWPNGNHYEGDFSDGRATGQGVLTYADGHSQKGEFANGHWMSPEVAAWAKTVSAEALAEYEHLAPLDRGQPTSYGILEGATDASGKVTSWTVKQSSGWPEFDQRWMQTMNSLQDVPPYPEPGKKIEYPYVYRPAAQAHATATQKYGTFKQEETGSHLARPSITGLAVPPDKAYADLTLEEKSVVRSSYDRMAAADEPPYPLQGQRPILDALRQIGQKVQAEGKLSMVVSINEQGQATKVSVLSSPDPQMTQAMANVLMLQKYKPAVCGGVPCVMDYPLRMNFTLRR